MITFQWPLMLWLLLLIPLLVALYVLILRRKKTAPNHDMKSVHYKDVS